MKTFEELSSQGTHFLDLIKSGKAYTTDPTRLADLINEAVDFTLDVLSYLGAIIGNDDKLDRVGLLATWYTIMLEALPNVVISARSTVDGFMLQATVPRGTKLERVGEVATASTDYHIQQLFFWNDLRPMSSARELCSARAGALIDDVFRGEFEADTGDN